LRDIALQLARRIRRRRLVRPEEEWGDPELRARIDALGPWFHNIDLRGTPTKLRSQMGESLSYPEKLWRSIEPHLPDLSGKSVLDIGCNAGYFSIACKRRGAERVVGIDTNQGTEHDFLAQARFAAAELGLEIEYREEDFFGTADGPFDVVLFLGVLYHLEDPVRALARIAELTREVVVIESLVVPSRRPVVEFRREGTDGDLSTRWVPSAAFIDERALDVGFQRPGRLPTRTRDRYLAVFNRLDNNVGRGNAS
jgi:SAM-dependent methyltransferase